MPIAGQGTQWVLTKWLVLERIAEWTMRSGSSFFMVQVNYFTMNGMLLCFADEKLFL